MPAEHRAQPRAARHGLHERQGRRVCVLAARITAQPVARANWSLWCRAWAAAEGSRADRSPQPWDKEWDVYQKQHRQFCLSSGPLKEFQLLRLETTAPYCYHAWSRFK